MMEFYDLLVQLRRCSEGRCRGCQRSHAEGCRRTVSAEAADAIEELSRDLDNMNDANIALYGALPKWIPVTERLPEDMVDVLCYYEYFRYGNYNRMYRTIDRGYVFEGRWFGEAGEGHKNKVFAWMPLPEPPKESE